MIASFSFCIIESTCTSPFLDFTFFLTPLLRHLSLFIGHSSSWSKVQLRERWTDIQTATSQSRLNTTQIPSFFSDRTISPPDNDNEYDVETQNQLRYDNEDRDDYEQDRSRGEGGMEGDDVPPPRKKRAQVRVACTHCQKACKRCSNTRYVFLLLLSSSSSLRSSSSLPLPLPFACASYAFLLFSSSNPITLDLPRYKRDQIAFDSSTLVLIISPQIPLKHDYES